MYGVPGIIKAAPDQAPTNEMFADGPRLPAFDLLSRHHIREGMSMIEDALNGDRWGGEVIPQCLEYLLRYGGAFQLLRISAGSLESLGRRMNAHPGRL